MYVRNEFIGRDRLCFSVNHNKNLWREKLALSAKVFMKCGVRVCER